MSAKAIFATLLASLSLLAAGCAGTPASAPSAATSASVPAAPANTSGRKEVTLVSGPRARLVETLTALRKNDVPAARTAFEAYDGEWNGIEVYVNFRSRALYGDIETKYQAEIAKALEAPQPEPSKIAPQVQAMIGQYDQAIKLSDTGPAISPLFDDVAALRIARAPLRNVPPALKTGDLAKAQKGFTTFKTHWEDVEDLVKARSARAYRDTEAALSQADKAMAASPVNAAEATPLVDILMARYNYGVNLLNAAARNADLQKTAFANPDLDAAVALGAAQQDLEASLSQWQAGSYQAAGEAASRANQRFEGVSAALQAKSGADAAPRKALDSYASLSAQAGDAKAVDAANRAAIEALGVAQQTLAGQFWTDTRFQEAYKQALRGA